MQLLLIAPFTAGLSDALGRLRIAPLLAGVRGEAALEWKHLRGRTPAVGPDDESAIGVVNPTNPVLVGASEGCVALSGAT
jgi:hypothetical protein